MNNLEYDALRGLPYLAQILYHRIRHEGDDVVVISCWSWLREALHVNSIPGRKHHTPTAKELRKAVSDLEERGLIEFSAEEPGKDLLYHQNLTFRFTMTNPASSMRLVK